MAGQVIQPVSEWKKESHDITINGTVSSALNGYAVIRLPVDAFVEYAAIIPGASHASATGVSLHAQAAGSSPHNGTIASTLASSSGALTANTPVVLTVDEENNKLTAGQVLVVRVLGTVATDGAFQLYVRYTTVIK